MENKIKTIITTFFFLIGPAFGSDLKLNPSEYFGFPNTLKDRDFFIKKSYVSLSQKLNNQIQSDLQDEGHISCRDNIAKVICLVEPTPKEKDPQDRECLNGSQSYAIYFEKLYDNYPPILQKMFCSLQHIYVEKEFFGTAYAGGTYDQNYKMDGAILGIRQSVLDQNLNLSDWASWKEQLSFGGVADSYTVTPDLPHIQITSETNPDAFLYFVIAHEFGHLFDFANEINKTKNCSEPQNDEDFPICEMEEGSWGAISWQTDMNPKSSNEFPLRSSLCFYNCDGKPLSKLEVPQVYSDFSKTDFISMYAATGPNDDFSDSLAYFLIAQNLNADYLIDTLQGQTYDIMAKLRSPIFSNKLLFLKTFLERTDIIYP